MKHFLLRPDFYKRGPHGRFRQRPPVLLSLLLLLVVGVTAVVSAQTGGLAVDYSRYWNTNPSDMPDYATHHSFISTYLKAPYNEVGLVVYTPPGYDNPANQNKRYPVIYSLHGVNGDELNYFSWFSSLQSGLMGLIEGTVPTNRNIPEAIVVVVNGGKQSFYNDFTDQFHGPDSNFPIQSESIIINEVIPFVDSQYRTIANGNGRGIEGFSMGGRGALKLAMKYPSMFCSAVSYAGAAYEYIPIPIYNQGPHALEDRLSYILSDNLPQINQTGLRIRLAVGSQDLAQVDTNDIFHEQLNACGVNHEYEIFNGVNHDFTHLYAVTGAEGAEFHYDCFVANGTQAQPAAVTLGISVTADDEFVYLPLVVKPSAGVSCTN